MLAFIEDRDIKGRDDKTQRCSYRPVMLFNAKKIKSVYKIMHI